MTLHFFTLHKHRINVHVFTYIFIALFIVVSNCINNTWLQGYQSTGELWQSTSDFIPVKPKAHGNITLADTMTMEFDFIFTGRKNKPRPGHPENFFRVGGDASAHGDGCQGEGSRYPSLWLMGGIYDMLSVSVSGYDSCFQQHSLELYGNITVGTSYHFHIAFNDSLLTVRIDDNWEQQWPHRSTLDQTDGVVVDVWWSSNVASGTDDNTGGGIFSNIKIISGVFTMDPTAQPTTTPTVHPSNPPTETPTHHPSKTPSDTPTKMPSKTPSFPPTMTPTDDPSSNPSDMPTTTPSDTPSTPPSTSPTIQPSVAPTRKNQKKSQLKPKHFRGACNFTCWECLEQIDVTKEDESWDIIFHSVTDTLCQCPQQIASQSNDDRIDVGANTDYYLQIEKYVDVDGEGDEVRYGLTANVVYWSSEEQDCIVSYFVNKNVFFGIYAQNVLIITFVLCDVASAEDDIRRAQTHYTQYFGMLFDVDLTHVTVSIDVGSFCSDNHKRLLLADTKDQEVTVVIVFTEAEDATAAEDVACDEVETEFPSMELDSCRVEITDGNSDDNESDDKDLIFGLTVLHFSLIVSGIVSLCIAICVALYCRASRAKKETKEALEMKYRKRTMSGETKKGVVTKGKIHREKDIDDSAEMTSCATVTIRDTQSKLKGTNISFKALPIESSKEQPATPIQLNVTTRTAPQWVTMPSNTATDVVSPDTAPPVTPFDAISETPKNTLPSSVGTLHGSNGGGSPYTLLPSYTESNKTYTSEKDMIDDVIDSHKANVIEYDDLTIHKQIGKGQFGAVFTATWEGNIVVVKHLNNVEINENDSDKTRKRKETRSKEMIAEIVLASSMPMHQNVVEIFGYIQSPFGVVMSYLAGDSVQKYVYRVYKKENESIPSIVEILIMLRKAAGGLRFLHDYGLCHRDIACRNILLGAIHNNRIESSTEVRISDFGMTRELTETNNDDFTQKTQSTFGPLKWMAPESIKAREYSKKSDVYMFGITMWEMFYGMEPYPGKTTGNVAISVVTKGQRPEIINDPQKYRHVTMPQAYLELMEHCWARQPEHRPVFVDIIQTLTQIEENPV
eukprot:150489_1